MIARSRPWLVVLVATLATLAASVPTARAATGSCTIASAQTITLGQENGGDGTCGDEFFRVNLIVGDRLRTDLHYSSDNPCLLEERLYKPSETDFSWGGATPSRTWNLPCAGSQNGDYEWRWTSPFSGSGILDFQAYDGDTYTFVSYVQHSTTVALHTLTPSRPRGAPVKIHAVVSSPAGVPRGYCEVFRRYGREDWAMRRLLKTGPHGGCKTTLTPSLRGTWRYRVRFTSNGGDWLTSTSPTRTTVVR
jgi:hypothetical protein